MHFNAFWHGNTHHQILVFFLLSFGKLNYAVSKKSSLLYLHNSRNSF